MLAKDEGGRKTPIMTNYAPVLYTRTADVATRIELPKGKEMCMPGMNLPKNYYPCILSSHSLLFYSYFKISCVINLIIRQIVLIRYRFFNLYLGN